MRDSSRRVRLEGTDSVAVARRTSPARRTLPMDDGTRAWDDRARRWCVDPARTTVLVAGVRLAGRRAGPDWLRYRRAVPPLLLVCAIPEEAVRVRAAGRPFAPAAHECRPRPAGYRRRACAVPRHG